MPISIHALREESDTLSFNRYRLVIISIHALREESDIAQKTLSLWGSDFNPRSPWGERHNSVPSRFLRFWFQSTLSVRRATHSLLIVIGSLSFQSTLSVRRATLPKRLFHYGGQISIHALREESDITPFPADFFDSDFNPRSPWGERPAFLVGLRATESIFQSTLSVRRATLPQCNLLQQRLISIHALREESDTYIRNSDIVLKHFNPRSPWGERLNKDVCTAARENFNPRSPWGERRIKQINPKTCYLISIHALREESDPFRYDRSLNPLNFNPRSPWGERPR